VRKIGAPMSFEPPPQRIEPTPRRIRVRLGDTVIADSDRAMLLVEYGPGRLPTYYVPLDDVRADALIDEAVVDGRHTWSVRAGERVRPAAAWSHHDPELAEHVTFSWADVDWYEEDEQVVEHARDPRHRVDTLRSSRRVEVFVEGTRIASSVRPLLLFETTLPTRYYLPFADVDTDVLVESDTVSVCPYKGRARYWSVRLPHATVTDAGWSYPDPIPENPKVRDLLAFFNERVDLVVDGEPLGRPHSPWSDGSDGSVGSDGSDVWG